MRRGKELRKSIDEKEKLRRMRKIEREGEKGKREGQKEEEEEGKRDRGRMR